MTGTIDQSTLAEQIDAPIPADLRDRYDCLNGKRDAEQLTDAEYDELRVLTARIETLGVQRVRLMIELATLRNTTLDEVAAEFAPRPTNGR